jgi:hypothetical protein
MNKSTTMKPEKQTCATCKSWPRTGMGAARKCLNAAVDRVTIAEAPACDHWEESDETE